MRKTNAAQTVLFDIEKSTEAKNEGMARAEAHAPQDWRKLARLSAIAVARTQKEFTADDVWKALGGNKPPEPRALGGIMNGLVIDGYIKATDRVKKTTQVSRHRGLVKVWESVIFGQSALAGMFDDK